MKNKKGFTLIELLAVIVILAIIALIATPIILNMINNSKKSASVDSAYGYIEAIEYNNSMSMLDSTKYPKIEDGENIDITTIEDKVKLKGTKPTSGKITITKGRITKATLCINNYNVEYDGKEAKTNGACDSSNNEEVVLKGDPILEKAKALVYENGACKTSGTYNYMDGCYIKGTSTNNYVWYNGFMWRIMGINSDGTVRLITDENIATMPYGYYNTALTYKINEGYINDWLNDYFYGNLNSTKSIIKEGAYFCNEKFFTKARTTCTSENKVIAKVGIISYDEYYLSKENTSSYLLGPIFWTMTPDSVSIIKSFDVTGKAVSCSIVDSYGVRPVINVDSTSTITKGDGTTSNYYVLSENKESDKTGTLGENVTSGEYIKLEGKTYRVVSKESDGIKLILDGFYDDYIPYGDNNTFVLDSGIGATLNSDVLRWLGLLNSNKIVKTMYYQGDEIEEGFSYINSLAKTNGISTKVGLIRMGEILSGQSSTILTQNYTTTSNNIFYYWTMNKYTNESKKAWRVYSNGFGMQHSVYNGNGVRPVIKVKNDLTISNGNGTWNNPYEIENK
ncbi:MAG: prepilin-type N-terminal cleavage/methylation domain-containing protein [Bacilli bacterium]|nr:prepilin-type N-terminal cleavage/methylation domain-containing protein [Bacilli bacterium]